MAPHRDAALEAQDQVLPDRLDRLEHAPVDLLGHARHLSARIRRLGADPLADERLEPACGPVQGVSLGHGTKILSHLCPMPCPPESGLNIAALARKTGVPAHTLRKWEQRYGVLTPARTTGGQRRYTEVDVARVTWLRDRLEDGYRIGQAAALLTDPRRRRRPHRPSCGVSC